MLVRTSTAHGPLQADATETPPVTINGNVITSHFIELIDPLGNELRVEFRAADEELWLITIPAGTTTPQPQPLLGGVTAAQFFAVRRQDNDGVWVLDRATMDITVAADEDNSLAIESADTAPIRMIASTMPRASLTKISVRAHRYSKSVHHTIELDEVFSHLDRHAYGRRCLIIATKSRIARSDR